MQLKPLFAILLLMVVACSKQESIIKEPEPIDPCANKNCGFGQCVPTTGACQCNLGYELDANGSCTILTEKKFEGTYFVTEICIAQANGNTLQSQYVGSIKIGNPDSIIEVVGLCTIPGFGSGFQDPVYATVKNDSIILYRQLLDNLFLLEGNGKISENRSRINMKYSVTDTSNGNIMNCDDVVFLRQ